MIDRLVNLPMKRSSDVARELKVNDEFAPNLDFYSEEDVTFICKTDTISGEKNIYHHPKKKGVAVATCCLNQRKWKWYQFHEKTVRLGSLGGCRFC